MLPTPEDHALDRNVIFSPKRGEGSSLDLPHISEREGTVCCYKLSVVDVVLFLLRTLKSALIRALSLTFQSNKPHNTRCQIDTTWVFHTILTVVFRFEQSPRHAVHEKINAVFW